jgi:hypothetical protein
MDLKTCVCPRCWGAKLVAPVPARVELEACPLCTGAGYVEDPELSEHFRFSELVGSTTAARLNMRNDPDSACLANLRRLCLELLEPLRELTGPLRVTSGYRTQALDVVADSGNPRWLHELSAHAIGAAADVVPVDPSKSVKDVFDAVIAFGPEHLWDQAITEAGCAHVALLCPYGKNRQRREALVRIHNATPPPAFSYLVYDGTPEQWAKIA